MSLRKLTAGSGYDYLTRQVAALDATEKGHTGRTASVAAQGRILDSIADDSSPWRSTQMAAMPLVMNDIARSIQILYL
jgi:hypothetical protein